MRISASGAQLEDVIYEGMAHVPREPIKLPYADLSSVSLVGVKWGVPPIQLNVNLLATSLGGVSEEVPSEGVVAVECAGVMPGFWGAGWRDHRCRFAGPQETVIGRPEI